MQAETLIEKIKSLPPEQIGEVENFVDFISERAERRLVQAATKMSEDAFQQVWDNDEDAAYDRL